MVSLNISQSEERWQWASRATVVFAFMIVGFSLQFGPPLRDFCTYDWACTVIIMDGDGSNWVGLKTGNVWTGSNVLHK